MGQTGEHERSFTEKTFYLREFSGRTLGIAVPDLRCAEHPGLRAIVEALGENGARVLLIVDASVPADAVQELGGEHRSPQTGTLLSQDTPDLPARAWRALNRQACVAIRASDSLGTACLDVGRRLRLYKLVRIADQDGFRDRRGRRRSFVDLAALEQLLGADDCKLTEAALLRQVEQLLVAGIPSVNICTVEALGAELFTYAGAGTLFTPHGYVATRRLGIEDYDAAEDLIARGVAEGYLLPRSDPALDALLSEAFGAFVEGRLLAGIGALRLAPGCDGGEVASLYTLTRFAGGGIGGHLVGFAVDQARRLGLRYVYACTVLPRVGAFFERQGFSAVSPDRIPAEKWADYDRARRERVTCYRRDI